MSQFKRFWQQLFAFRALDPNDFIMKLGLDPEIQQDAQEFSKLFLTLLESSLQCQTDETIKNIVQNQVYFEIEASLQHDPYRLLNLHQIARMMKKWSVIEVVKFGLLIQIFRQYLLF